MKIAIHHTGRIYSSYWIKYCDENHIDYKIVNAYANDIINQVEDCDIFMWHYSQDSAVDMNFAKQLLFTLQQIGKIVFPDFNTGWHFDDKLGQKYLFEALGIPIAPSYAFYSKVDALFWAKTTEYPKVFKLRGGAGSSNVRLITNYKQCCKYIHKAFGRGFKAFDRWEYIANIIRLYKTGTATKRDCYKGLGALILSPKKSRLPRQRDYIYFQDFIPNQGFDYRVEICGDKCIAMIRTCRKGDFRASGAHQDNFDWRNIPRDVIEFAFNVANKLGAQSCALDIVRSKETNKLYLLESSYCYGVYIDEFNHGYWREDGWYNEEFNGLYWMIEYVIKQYQNLK